MENKSLHEVIGKLEQFISEQGIDIKNIGWGEIHG